MYISFPVARPQHKRQVRNKLARAKVCCVVSFPKFHYNVCHLSLKLAYDRINRPTSFLITTTTTTTIIIIIIITTCCQLVADLLAVSLTSP